MDKTSAAIREWIYRSLGKGVVNVELTSDQLDDVIDHAESWWQTWVGQSKAVLYTMTGGTEYDGTAIAADIDSIVDVTFEGAGADFTNLFAWADVEINPYTYTFSNGYDYSTLVLN